MSNDQRFGQSDDGTVSQTGTDTGGRSPEYRDNLNQQQRQDQDGGIDRNVDAMGSAASGVRDTSGIDRPSTDFNDTATGAHTGGTGASTSFGGSQSTASHHDLGDNTDGLGRDQTDRVTTDETGTLISADKVQGTAVYDASGERLGTIDSLMLNKRSGKVAYAVMSFGGFLGIGERYHPLPWDKLTYDTEKGGYNVGATTEQLRAGPTYSRDELDQFGDDRRSSNEVDDYYGRTALGGGITGAGGIPNV